MKITFRNPLKGFTLIELMVAISIVAILATVGFTIMQTAQAAGRDAKRRQDVDAISQALETNWNPVNSTYLPLNTPNMFTSGTRPVDPISNADYTYTPGGITTAAQSSYLVCAQLEKAGGNSTSPTTLTPPSGNPLPAANYYCKKNQQQ